MKSIKKLTLKFAENYIYYNEIVDMLNEFEVYGLYQEKLRIAAFNAMKKKMSDKDYSNE